MIEYCTQRVSHLNSHTGAVYAFLSLSLAWDDALNENVIITNMKPLNKYASININEGSRVVVITAHSASGQAASFEHE